MPESPVLERMATGVMDDARKSPLILSRCNVFFDFDNTVTHFDVLDDIIRRFSVTREWLEYEKAWVSGKIGSRECLQGQLKGVRISKKNLSAYLSKIKVDPSFKRLLSFLKRHGVRPMIVSDSFSFLIKSILKRNRIMGLRVYANRVRFNKDRLLPEFPHRVAWCADCAHCKKRHLTNRGSGDKTKIYIGDGLSDICPAQQADLVFAKGSLLKHLKDKKKPCVEFSHLGDVYEYLKEVSRGTEA
jgi:2-hydroxy-3-keto-5-methylthiopentenyl-1-phosphate phosphatase